jgi:hypothetical protein
MQIQPRSRLNLRASWVRGQEHLARPVASDASRSSRITQWEHTTDTQCSAQLQHCRDRIVGERFDARPVLPKETLNVLCGAVAQSQPHNLWGSPPEDAEPVKILILRNQHTPEVDCALPHHLVCRAGEALRANMHCRRTEVFQAPQEGFGQLLVEEHAHD